MNKKSKRWKEEFLIFGVEDKVLIEKYPRWIVKVKVTVIQVNNDKYNSNAGFKLDMILN